MNAQAISIIALILSALALVISAGTYFFNTRVKRAELYASFIGIFTELTVETWRYRDDINLGESEFKDAGGQVAERFQDVKDQLKEVEASTDAIGEELKKTKPTDGLQLYEKFFPALRSAFDKAKFNRERLRNLRDQLKVLAEKRKELGGKKRP